MTLFTKRQIDGALKARHLYETLGYPSNADFESVLRAGGIRGCTVTVEDAKVAQKKQVAKRAMNMSSNGGEMRISKECKVLGYDFWVW